MTATPAERIDWETLTEVDAETIEEVVYSVDGGETDWVDVRIKCVQPGPRGWKFGCFVDALFDHFHTYVLPPRVREETPAHRLFRKARRTAAPNEDFENCGVVSEFLLYLFTEVYLDAPLAAHRLYRLDSRNQEKKGSDGIFVGRHDGEECLYVGEAKFYDGISRPIKDAFESISEFHSRGVNDRMRRELDLASADLAEKQPSLSTEEFEALAERLAPHSHEDYKIVHPVFIGHQTSRIDCYPAPGRDVISPDDDRSENEEQVRSELESSIAEISYVDKQKSKQSALSPESLTAEIVLFPFPVHDTGEFKELLYEGLFEPENA